uniref:Uncharacterized protein n=1 Tax=viral metagenome TaxID=1070528 RepID=A0A6C0HZR8_9ZZZZ
MSKYCTIVFNTKELLLNIAKYLSSLNIYQLFNAILQHINNYDMAINYIYTKLYNGVKYLTKPDIQLLTSITARAIRMGHTYTYAFQTNIQFSPEEICIRNIMLETFNISSIVDNESDEEEYESDEEDYEAGEVDNDVDNAANADANATANATAHSCIRSNKITSLYYLLYDNMYLSLLNRFIIDGIVISPFECTHSNMRRKTIHYYGNEQTLRIALRYKKYDMIQQILSDIEYLSVKFNLTFIWNNNNILYESLNNSDIIGFQLIINFAIKHRKLKYLLLQISDEDVAYSNDNSFRGDLALRGESMYNRYNPHPSAVELYPNNGDDRVVQEQQNNALFYALFIDLINIESWRHLGQLRKQDNLDASNVIIVEKDGRPNFILSEKFQNYIDIQFNMLQQYCIDNLENLEFFNVINMAIRESSNIYVFHPYRKQNRNGNNREVFLLFELLSIEYKNNKLFLMMFLITKNMKNFDPNFKYHTKTNILTINKNCNIIGLNGCTIIEYIKAIIHFEYNNGKIFGNTVNDIDFAYFINLILCYKLFI